MEILIKSSYKSLPAGLKINNLPEFIIITGENGSGKTHLLECLRMYGVDNIPQNQINWIPSDWKASPLQQNKQNRNRQTYEQQMSSIKTTLINSLRQRGSRPQQQYEPYLLEIAQKLNKTIKELTEEDITQNIPYDIQNKLLVENDFISLFTMWRYDYDSKCGEANRKDDKDTLERLREEKSPWALINELFEKYNFDYRLVDPTDQKGQFNSLYFYHKNTSLRLTLNDLSSGEQMIAMLILWSYHPSTGKRCQLLLLDEPDAFLHPSMCELLMKILFEKMYKEYGIKIIMSTHSPSTIVYAPEESIYLMQKTGNRFKKTSKAAAIKELSSGMIAFSRDYAKENISLFYKAMNSKKNTIILVEGKHDIDHIQLAHKKLYRLEPNFEMISLSGADKLRNFFVSAPIEQCFSDKKVIAIFDADEKGINRASKINGTVDKTHDNCYLCNNNWYYMILPAPHSHMSTLQNCPIEMLYPLSLLNKHKMIKKLPISFINNKFKDKDQLSHSDWSACNDRWCYRLDPDLSKKNDTRKKGFASSAENFEIKHFDDFKVLFEQINFLIRS
jgi:predicted ATP-dependent endonuclease of OLD family